MKAAWLLLLLPMSCASVPAKSPDPVVVELWPGKVPGDAGISGEESTKIYPSPLVGPTPLISNVSRPSTSGSPRGSSVALWERSAGRERDVTTRSYWSWT